MNQTMKMAKVITMKVELDKNRIVELVTTVDPIVTVEMVFRVYGLRGRIVKSEETNVMPLSFALDCAYRQRNMLGIVD